MFLHSVNLNLYAIIRCPTNRSGQGKVYVYLWNFLLHVLKMEQKCPLCQMAIMVFWWCKHGTRHPSIPSIAIFLGNLTLDRVGLTHFKNKQLSCYKSILAFGLFWTCAIEHDFSKKIFWAFWGRKIHGWKGFANNILSGFFSKLFLHLRWEVTWPAKFHQNWIPLYCPLSV